MSIHIVISIPILSCFISILQFFVFSYFLYSFCILSLLM